MCKEVDRNGEQVGATMKERKPDATIRTRRKERRQAEKKK